MTISQMNAGKRVTGMSRKSDGIIMLSQLSSAMTATTRPNHISHRGSSLVTPALTETPAMSKPIGGTATIPAFLTHLADCGLTRLAYASNTLASTGHPAHVRR